MRNDDLWFTDSRVRILLSNRDNARGVSVTEQVLPADFSPPLHVHHAEDETFYILDGQFRFEMDGGVRLCGPGDLVHAPAGAVHSFLVLSPEGGRCLTITQGGFEDMVRAVSRPAEHDRLPEQAPPTPAQQAMLADACLAHNIELLGPPLAA